MTGADMTKADPDHSVIGANMDERLTPDEDSELRGLSDLARTGQLSEQSCERFTWLSLRDRRHKSWGRRV